MKKNKLSEKEVVHLAKLASLNLSSEEIKNFTTQLSSIIDYVDLLAEVKIADTTNSKLTDLSNVLREDLVDDSKKITNFDNLKLIDSAGKKYFKVKKVM